MQNPIAPAVAGEGIVQQARYGVRDMHPNTNATTHRSVVGDQVIDQRGVAAIDEKAPAIRGRIGDDCVATKRAVIVSQQESATDDL